MESLARQTYKSMHVQHQAVPPEVCVSPNICHPQHRLQQLPAVSMPSATFRLRYFDIHQEDCAMKVGTDGMLLGSWAHPQGASHILDIGTGTGVLALMAAQRAPPAATIHAIDIDQHACAQAARNAAASPFAANVSVFHCALQDLVEKHLVEMQGCPPASPCGAACGGQAHASACGCSGAATNALPDAPPAPSTVYSDAPDVAPFMGEPSSSVRGKDSDNVDGRGGDGDGGRNRGGGIGAGSGRVESPLEHRGAPCIVHEPSAWALPRGGYDMIISNPPFFESSSKPPSDLGGWVGLTPPSSTQPGGGGSTPTLEGSCLQCCDAPSAGDVNGADGGDSGADGGGEAPPPAGCSSGGRHGRGGGREKGGRVRGTRRALARHADAGGGSSRGLTYEDLIMGVTSLLAPGGSFFTVLPSLNREADRLTLLASEAGLRLVRVLRVVMKGTDPKEKRRLMCFKKRAPTEGPCAGFQGRTIPGSQSDSPSHGGEVSCVDATLVVREPCLDNGKPVLKYTQAYRDLVAAFHHPVFLERL